MNAAKTVGTILAVLVGTTLGPWPAGAVESGAQAPAQPVIVVLNEGVDAGTVSAEHAQDSGIRPDIVYQSAFQGYSAVLSGTQVQQLETDPRVSEILPDRSVAAPQVGAIADPPQPAQIVSNGVKRTGALESPTAKIDGIDERVDADIAVLDTGLQSDHPDLNVVGGVDCASGDGYEDAVGHGTMVGGLAAALDNEIGRVGVAPGARLWSVRVADSWGIITDSSLLCGLDWVTANAETVDVANLSLGGQLRGNDVDCQPPNENMILEAVCSAIGAGVPVVAAAGNEASDASGVEPAGYSSVITVSALSDTDGQPGGVGPVDECVPGEIDDSLASYSNYGPAVDIAAPGTCIDSTYLGGQYAVASGTSFSAPLVVGGAALYLANNPGASPGQVQAVLQSSGEAGPLLKDRDDVPEPILNVSLF
ncbi:S8 family serine peptidase [Arthrobacter sp. TMN-37]